MKKFKGFTAICMISGILLLLFNIVLFALCGFSGHLAPFWLSMAFTNLALLSTLICVFLLKGQIETPKDWFMGYPFYKHCLLYIVCSFLATVIFMALDKTVPWVLVFSVHLIITAVFLVLLISCFYAKQAIENIETNVKVNTVFMKQLRLDAEALAQQAEDPALKAALEKLSEELRYSDPVSSPELAETEARLAEKLDAVGACLSLGDSAGALDNCKLTLQLLSDRNRRCKTLKA